MRPEPSQNFAGRAVELRNFTLTHSDAYCQPLSLFQSEESVAEKEKERQDPD